MVEDITGKVVAEKFRVEGLIARGREGDLYHARHILTDKAVSLRLLPARADEKARALFFEQAKSAAHLDHPNLLNVTDYGTDANGVAYAVCDALTDNTLRTAILRDRQVPAESVAETGKQIAAGLAAAHAAGIVHGNLTADNVVFADTGDGNVRAKVFGFASPNAMIRSDDVFDATPSDFAYLAPEQCSGSEFSDERSDVYSLGVILYEMVAGVVPFTGEKPTDVILKHIEEAPAPLVAFRQDVPAGIEPIILKALAKDPTLRYQSATELHDDLAALSSGTAQSAAAGAGPGNKNIWTTVAMVVIGIGALAAALIYATSVKQTDPTTALPADANAMPVQPINPATGFEEQTLAAMPAMTDSASNSSLTAPDTLPGGDGYNPWATGAPPGGMPEYIPQGGEVYTVPGGGSQFMPNCVPQPSGVLLCYGTPPANANVRPSPTPRNTPPANANVETTPTPGPTSVATPTPAVRPTGTPRATPAPTKQPTPGTSDRPDPV